MVFETTAGGGYRSMCPQQWIETYQCHTEWNENTADTSAYGGNLRIVDCRNQKKKSIHEKSFDKLDAEMFIACKLRS